MKPPMNIIQSAPIFDADQVAKYGQPYLQALYDRCVSLAYSQADLFGYNLDPISLSPIISTIGDPNEGGMIVREGEAPKVTFKSLRAIKKEQAILADELDAVLNLRDLTPTHVVELQRSPE